MNRVHHILMALLLAASGSALADEVTYLHADVLGSPIAATDENGTLLWEERYEPYGERYYEPATASGNKRSFTGHAEDASGLVYMGARYYNPEIGRFYAADPGPLFAAGHGFVNRYAYVANAPTVAVDRDGRVLETLWDVANFGYGIYSFTRDAIAGDWDAARVDAGGVAVDGAAMAVPFVPGGASLAIRAERAAKRTMEAVRAARWGNATTLADHFARHGADFGAKNADDYARMASEFLEKSQQTRLPTKIGPDGTIRVYDPASNTFGAFNADGTTKTFFKPEAKGDYWNAQPGLTP